MIQSAGINFKSTSLPLRRKLDKRLSGALAVVGLVVAAFLYWRYLNHLTHVRPSATASRTISTATAPATGKPELAATSPMPGEKPVLTNTDNQVPAKAASVGFADSLMAVLSPSAKAETIQPEMQPTLATETAKPAKRVAVQVAARSSSHESQAMTAEQKRLKIAQAGFGDVMDLAYRYPDAYGFMPDENLNGAKLGNPIPVYTIAHQDQVSYKAGQLVKPLLQPVDEWVYPIILGNRIRFMVQVKYVGHDYVLGHGSRALAMVYDKIVTRWPANEGFHPQLLINPNMPDYYFTIPELPDQNITDTSRMFDFKPSLSPATVILASWR